MKITSFKKWRTEDGTEHVTMEMAVHWVCTCKLVEALTATNRTVAAAEDVLNDLSSHQKLVRDWLDACEAMNRASLR
jgi:hypothetical protein